MRRFRISATQFSLSLTIVLLATNSLGQSTSDRSLVAPGSVGAKEPFTFAAQGVVEGEVIEIKTIEGEVVATEKTDKYGRVFLASGLAAGSYLLSAGHGDHPVSGRLYVGGQGHNPPRSDLFKIDEPVRLPSQEHPDARDLTALLGSGIKIPVLAASLHEIVLATPVSLGIKPGHYQVTVLDSQGRTIIDQPGALCQVTVKLSQNKVISGGSTTLSFLMAPADVAADLQVKVLSGPITFSQGKETTVSIHDGQAVIPVQTVAGQTGRFSIGWMFSPNGQESNSHPIGGGTEASKEPEWIPFEDPDGRKGKVQVTEANGVRKEKKIYEDGGSTLVTIKTGDQRKTEDVETTTKVDGVETQVTEHREWTKDKETGEWKFKSGTKTTDTYGEGHKVVDTKTEKLKK